MPQLRRLIPLIILALTACGESATAPPAAETMTGIWVGTTAGIVSVRADLVEIGGAVTGSGTFTHGTDEYPMLVSGTHSFPDVNLRVTIEGQSEMDFVGTFQGSDTVVGTLAVPGFGPIALTIRRE
jgi:hypothetical protein